MKMTAEQWQALSDYIENSDDMSFRQVARYLLVENDHGLGGDRDKIVAMLDGLTGVYTTKELSVYLPDVRLIDSAKVMPPGYATHDGPWFEKYGRRMRAWRWHGKAKPNVAAD